MQQIYTRTFRRDTAKIIKRGKNIFKMQQVIELLCSKNRLPAKYKDHILVGNYKGRRECHIEPDWLLIYQIQQNTIIFERTGTHADLFKK